MRATADEFGRRRRHEGVVQTIRMEPTVSDGGKCLERSIPSDIVFSDCDKDPSDGQHYFESWTGNVLWNAPYDSTDRHEQGPGQVDRLWILDVEGRRLVIDASYMPGATGQDKADAQQVVDSIRFE